MMNLSPGQTKTLSQIVASPGKYKVARSQPGFNLTSAMSLVKKGLATCERSKSFQEFDRSYDGNGWDFIFPTEAGVDLAAALSK